MVENDELYALIERAHNNDREAIDELLWHFDPMIKRRSYINRGFDEDCYQHLRISFVKALDSFMNVAYPVWELFRDIKRVAARKEAYAKWLESQDGETHP